MKLTQAEKKSLLKMARSKKVRDNALAMDAAIAKLPKLTPLQYIRWLDEYQRAFGQFPVSHEPPQKWTTPF